MLDISKDARVVRGNAGRPLGLMPRSNLGWMILCNDSL